MSIRKYINIVEGNYIPQTSRSIKMSLSPYELYRALQKLGANFQKATNTESGDSIMTFQTPLDYKYFTDALRSQGISFTDIVEQKEEDKSQTKSPVPSPGFRDIKYY